MYSESHDFISFFNLEGKQFCIPRNRLLHVETYSTGKDTNGDDILDLTKSYVNFVSPNPNSKGSLHAVVDMSVNRFQAEVLGMEWELNVTPDEL